MLGNAFAAARAVEQKTKKRMAGSGPRSGDSEPPLQRTTPPSPSEAGNRGRSSLLGGVRRWPNLKKTVSSDSSESTGKASKNVLSPVLPESSGSHGSGGHANRKTTGNRRRPSNSVATKATAAMCNDESRKTGSGNHNSNNREMRASSQPPLTNDQIMEEIAAVLEREQDSNTIEQLVIEMKAGDHHGLNEEMSQVTLATGIQTSHHQPPGDAVVDPKKSPCSSSSHPSDLTSRMHGSQKNLDEILADYDELMAEEDDSVHVTASQPSTSSAVEQDVLFTFQRVTNKGRMIEATLNAHCVVRGKEVDEKLLGGELMSDLVKRLQKDRSPVLKFEPEEMTALKSKEKEIVFSIKHMKNTKFSKTEFGEIRAATLACMTKERPILVGIQAEDVAEGESIELF